MVFRRLDTALAGALIPEGKCAIYTVGDNGSLALCIESVLHWGDELTQVRSNLLKPCMNPT